jgi:hypothetical protein
VELRAVEHDPWRPGRDLCAYVEKLGHGLSSDGERVLRCFYKLFG